MLMDGDHGNKIYIRTDVSTDKKPKKHHKRTCDWYWILSNVDTYDFKYSRIT